MGSIRLVAVLAAAVLAVAACDADSTMTASDAQTSVEFVAYDMGYDPTEATVGAGEIEITLVNEGAAVHNVIVEEAGDVNVAEARSGETATGTITLSPGTYTIYCDVPGHRSAGMDRTLVVQ